MTHREKIYELENAIRQLYENEGRSKSYISRLLEVDRSVLTEIINEEWKLVQGKQHYLKPSNQKFLNRHKQLIKSRLDQDVTITDIAKELGVSRQYLSRTIIDSDKTLRQAKLEYHNRKGKRPNTKFNTPIEKIEGEVWKDILGYEGYKVSNLGRVASNKVGDPSIYYEMKPNVNSISGRFYIHLINPKRKRKALSLPRVVAHTFVDGYSKTNNTVNHKDGDVTNNCATNLEWVSQSENNKHAYDKLNRPINISQKRWKKILVNDKYEFKTIRAFAKFINKSETQARRYITGESNSNYKIDIIY